MAQPYHAIAQQLGLAPETVMVRLRRMLASGIIRRIGVVPNHYALGYKGNGMSVWDIADENITELGGKIEPLPEHTTQMNRRERSLNPQSSIRNPQSENPQLP